MSDRSALLRSAATISVVSVLLSGVVGSVAVASAVGAGSLSMLGFGVDAVVDAAASVALIWRFRVEGREPARGDSVERIAERVVGAALVVLAGYIAVASVRSLVEARAPLSSELATAILVASVIVLPPIALRKRAIARRLASGALRADSVLTGIAAGLAAISLLGISASTRLGWWWADAVAALVVAGVMLREGVKSIAMSRRSGRAG